MPFDIDPNETQNLAVIITELNAKIEVLIERQGEVADNVAKIKEGNLQSRSGIICQTERVGGLETNPFSFAVADNY